MKYASPSVSKEELRKYKMFSNKKNTESRDFSKIKLPPVEYEATSSRVDQPSINKYVPRNDEPGTSKMDDKKDDSAYFNDNTDNPWG